MNFSTSKQAASLLALELSFSGCSPVDASVPGADYLRSPSNSRHSSTATSPALELSSRASTDELPEQHRDAEQQRHPEDGYAGQPKHSHGLQHSMHDQQRQQPMDASCMTVMQRLQATCRLWPYMVPLFVVYFAEYAMQSGTWTAIGRFIQPQTCVYSSAYVCWSLLCA